MKTIYIALGGLLFLTISVHAEVQCPDACLIEENISLFSDMEKGKVTLDSQTWNFESGLTTSEIIFVKGLNTEISDIDLHTCNYLIYPIDTNIEDASLLLHQRRTVYY